MQYTHYTQAFDNLVYSLVTSLGRYLDANRASVYVVLAVFALFLIIFLIEWRSKRRAAYIKRCDVEETERIQATLPPLQPGALFTAAITPLPGNAIQFAVRLSPEARDIIARHNLSPVRLFDYPNPDYEDQKRKDQIAASVEPYKNIDVTIEDFCRPAGIWRSFPSASEAKAWARQLRQGMNIFENELEANQKPAEAATFTVMRKS
jgi:hypothetical protein